MHVIECVTHSGRTNFQRVTKWPRKFNNGYFVTVQGTLITIITLVYIEIYINNLKTEDSTKESILLKNIHNLKTELYKEP